MTLGRGAGILLHITSLPDGVIGPSAYRFVDLLAEAGQKYWQILPLGQTGYGGSPYQCFSAFAGNIGLIQETGDRREESGENQDRFNKENWFWLDDYALFQAMRKANGWKAWNEWAEPLRLRDPKAIEQARRDHRAAIDEE